jgi:hypothetical protein
MNPIPNQFSQEIKALPQKELSQKELSEKELSEKELASSGPPVQFMHAAVLWPHFLSQRRMARHNRAR